VVKDLHILNGSTDNHWLKERCVYWQINTNEDAIQQKVPITILVATYRFCSLANHRCHTLRSWCNSNMASASALVAGSSDEPIRLMVSATHTSSSCRSAWNLCSVYAAARASLRHRASCCNERQSSWSSDSLLQIGADRSGCLCDRRHASPSCSYWNQVKCIQYNVSIQIFGLKWQVYCKLTCIPISLQLMTSRC